jgi:hypothetical protein
MIILKKEKTMLPLPGRDVRTLLRLGLASAVLLLIFSQQVTHAQSPSLSPADVQALLERRLTQEFVPDQVIVKMKPVAGRSGRLAFKP